jgi:hypothetical protein
MRRSANEQMSKCVDASIWFIEFIPFVEFVWLLEPMGWKNILGKMGYLFIER